MMHTRRLGYTDLELSTIGLGAWAMGGGNWQYAWGPQDDSESITAIHCALELGVTWIDTAPMYGLGHSEEVVGRALTGRRNKPVIATKCGIGWNEATRTTHPARQPAAIRREAESSLRRLQTEVIDLYQIHWPDPDESIEEVWGTIADLIREGKLPFGGVSNCSVGQIKRLQPIHPVASLQPRYNMFCREVEAELLAYCAANQIGVVAYSPMQSGLLTGRFTRERAASLPLDDWRRNNEHYREPELGANLALIEKLRPIAARYDETIAQLSLAWVLRRPELTAAIVGVRRPSQIEETAAAGNWNLPAEAAAEIDALLTERQRAIS